MNLHKFFINPFDEDGISLAELLAFSADHLQKLTFNNPGGSFTARIAATTTALTGVQNAFTDDQTKLGIRKARKLAKNTFRTTLTGSLAKIDAAVVAKFGRSSPEQSECFPHGRTAFNRVIDDEVAEELQTVINGVTAFQAQLGAQLVTDAKALLTGWNAVYAPSEQSTATKAATEATKASARAALQLELFKNLLTLALNFPNQPHKLDAYLRQSLLEHPASEPAPAPHP